MSLSIDLLNANFIHASDQVIHYGIEYSIRIVGAVAIFLFGKLVIKTFLQLIRKAMQRSHVDATLIGFSSNALFMLLMSVVIIAALANLGIDTTSFVAAFGAIGLALGLALKDTLSNVGAAVLIIFFRPFKVGDFIEVATVMGTVKQITLFSTTLLTGDNRSIIIPNSTLINGNIINYTDNDSRRIDMIFELSYGANIAQAKELMLSIIQEEERILKTPESLIAVGELTPGSVKLYVRPWVAVSDYWNVKFDLTERVKKIFDENHILFAIHEDGVK